MRSRVFVIVPQWRGSFLLKSITGIPGLWTPPEYCWLLSKITTNKTRCIFVSESSVVDSWMLFLFLTKLVITCMWETDEFDIYIYAPGGVHLPVSSSGRILVSFWWLFIIVMTSAYSGNLIASLTVTRKTPPFVSLEDVFTDANLKFGLLGGAILHRTIEVTGVKHKRCITV